MLNKAKALKGFTLDSLDGAIGKINEFYFDDLHWTIRYVVADTGNWLAGRQVLISPYALADVNEEEKSIAINLTKKQIEDSPSLDSDKPVSRHFEEDYYGHYGWPMYWGGPYLWGAYPYIVRDREKWRESTQTEKAWDPHFFVIILLSIIGVAITDYAPTASWAYWIFMVAALGTSAVAIEKTLLHRKDVSFTKLWVTQLIHWGVTLVVILLSFTFVKTGRMTNESSGLVILLILSLSTFLDGYHVGWCFYLAGIFLGITAVLAAYFEEFMWIMLVIAATIIVFSIYLEKYLMANHNAIQEPDGKF